MSKEISEAVQGLAESISLHQLSPDLGAEGSYLSESKSSPCKANRDSPEPCVTTAAEDLCAKLTSLWELGQKYLWSVEQQRELTYLWSGKQQRELTYLWSGEQQRELMYLWFGGRLHPC